MLRKQPRVLHPGPQSTGREPDWACSAQQGHLHQSAYSFPNSALKRRAFEYMSIGGAFFSTPPKPSFRTCYLPRIPSVSYSHSSLLCLIPMPLCSPLLLLLPLLLSHTTSPVSHQNRPFTFTQNGVQIQDPIIRAGFLGPLLVLITLCGFSEKAEPEKRVSR